MLLKRDREGCLFSSPAQLLHLQVKCETDRKSPDHSTTHVNSVERAGPPEQLRAPGMMGFSLVVLNRSQPREPQSGEPCV